MATQKVNRKSGGQRSSGSYSSSGGSVYSSSDMGNSPTSGQSIGVTLGLIVCMLCLIGLITLTGFLYADLQSARGANRIIEAKVKKVIERCDKD